MSSVVTPSYVYVCVPPITTVQPKRETSSPARAAAAAARRGEDSPNSRACLSRHHRDAEIPDGTPLSIPFPPFFGGLGTHDQNLVGKTDMGKKTTKREKKRKEKQREEKKEKKRKAKRREERKEKKSKEKRRKKRFSSRSSDDQSNIDLRGKIRSTETHPLLSLSLSLSTLEEEVKTGPTYPGGN
jgi:flagellar biosynthesis GTPase FlhF